MSFSEENPLRLILIDDAKTLFPEDGVAADLKTGTLFFASVVPDFTNADFDLLKLALKLGSPQRSTGFFKTSRHRVSISRQKTRRGLIVTVEKPYNECQITVGTIKAKIKLGHECFHGRLSIQVENELNMLRDYCQDFAKRKVGPGMIVQIALQVLNDAAEDAMRNHNLPFLGTRRGDWEILVSEGKFRINRPLRDATAFVNCLQLAHYLEYEQVLFSEEFLRDLVFY